VRERESGGGSVKESERKREWKREMDR